MLSLRYALLLLALCAASPWSMLAAQNAKYSDYTWAKGLYAEFGFDDLAEKIFTEMAEGRGRSLTEQQQGRLGLAELKQSLARRAATFEARFALYKDADRLMSEAIKAWPEQTSPEYIQALFTQVYLLQELGEASMAAIRDGAVVGTAAEEARKEAGGAFAKALASLNALKERLGEPDPEAEREKWRLRNRAWYELCSVLYSEALTHEKGKSSYFFGLDSARTELEKFILENETEDEEAMLGALYGYLLLAQVQAAKGENNDAEGSMTGVIAFIRWETPEKLHPVIQAVIERTYRQLIGFFNDTQRYDRAIATGEEFIKRWEERKMSFRIDGRLALVNLAQAHLRGGDAGQALRFASRVVEEGGGDATSRAANRLVAEIIAGAPDRTRFSPDILYSAARGAQAAGEEKLEDAIDYFQLVILTAPGIENPTLRAERTAEAWFSIGNALRRLGRPLEAAMAFGEGYTRGGSKVTKDDLSNKLGRTWLGLLRNLSTETRSKEIQALAAEVQSKVIESVDLPRGDILYRDAVALEDEAKALGRRDIPAAIAKYEAAAKKFAESADAGGPRREQSLIRAARTGLTIAELHVANKDMAKAKPLLEKAVQEFQRYLAFTRDPANAVSDAESLARRADAIAISRWSIARAYDSLKPAIDSKNPEDKATRQRMIRESLAVTQGYETEIQGQTSLKLAVVGDRLRDHLELGEIENAEKDLQALRALDSKHASVPASALRIGQAIRGPAEEQWKKLVDGADPSDAAWPTIIAKPEVQALLPTLRRSYAYYREWLLAGDGSAKFGDWNFVSSRFFQIGDLAECVDLLQRLMERFGNDSTVKEEELVTVQRRLLLAAVELAVAAEDAGDAAKAGPLWSTAGRMADSLLKSSVKAAGTASTKRAAAVAYGGYLSDRFGRIEYRPALGRFGEAAQLWEELVKGVDPSTDAWWEAQFYNYYATWKKMREDPNGNTARLRKSIELLRASRGDSFGGQSWRSRYEWLLAEVR